MDQLAGEVGWMKIGMQLFTAEGPEIVRRAQRRGFRVFLDLKFHDIPNTMRHAVRSAVDLGVQMTTVHALSGPKALEQVAEEASGSELQLLAVTLLTSMDDAQAASIGLTGSMESRVLSLAKLSFASGVTGVVASPLEAAMLKSNIGADLCLVTPGIRPPDAPVGDQKRMMTPEEALRAGSDYLVIGRPITAAPEPAKAAAKIRSALQHILDAR